LVLDLAHFIGRQGAALFATFCCISILANTPVTIDEIQYAPELLLFIKIYADTHKKTGDFWLTGSQMFHMMKNVKMPLWYGARYGIWDIVSRNSETAIKSPEGMFSEMLTGRVHNKPKKGAGIVGTVKNPKHLRAKDVHSVSSAFRINADLCQ